MLVILLIVVTLLFVNSENVKYIFPLTDYSQKHLNKSSITFTLFVDLAYLLLLNLVYLASYGLIVFNTSTNQITILLKLPDFIN